MATKAHCRSKTTTRANFRRLASHIEVTLKKRTKMLALSAALASAATLTTAPAHGDTPQAFLRIDDNYVGTKHIAIADYDTSTGKVIRGQYVTFEKPLSAYWPVTDPTAGWLTVVDQVAGVSWRTPGSGTDLYGHLPACYIITPSGQLQWNSNQACIASGAQQESW